ncbi:MAG: hypothetical protein SPG40_05905 [Kiritimatiellia bacterium]|nr:hypothetical protein [Kiritimatiellia bacterium]
MIAERRSERESNCGNFCGYFLLIAEVNKPDLVRSLPQTTGINDAGFALLLLEIVFWYINDS